MNTTTNLCYYGCGQEAKFVLSNNTPCCSRSRNQCPAIKQKNREKALERWKNGVYDSSEYRKKISHPSWNKGKILKPRIYHPGKCEVCGKDHDGTYGSGKFCSQRCAKRAASLYCDKKEANLKTSQTLKSRTELEVLDSAIKGIRTYNKNHPERQFKLPESVRKAKVYHKETGLFTIETIRPRFICKICGNEKQSCEHPEICKYLSHCNINNLKLFGFDISKIGSTDIYLEVIKFRELLIDLYYNQKLSVQMIQKKYGLKDWFVIYDWFKRFNIKIRTTSESVSLAYEQGRLTPQALETIYKTQIHTTWDGYSVVLRSSYEKDFANILDSKKIHYEVETLRIPYYSRLRNKRRISIPDFYIPDTNSVYEVKGDFTYTKIDIEDRFLEYKNCGFSKIILILEHKEYEYPNLPEQKILKNIDFYWN